MPKLVVYVFSVFLALLLHSAVVGLLLVNWQAESSEPTQIEPLYINASLMRQNPIQTRKREELAAQLRAQQKKARQIAERNKALAGLNRDKKLEPVQIDEAVPKRVEPPPPQSTLSKARQEEQLKRQREELFRMQMEEELTLAVMEEQERRKAVTDDEKSMAFVAQIQQDIISNWSRPPSARNGMQALLRVFLVPTGEVVDVVVQESSGNEAFDRSAILAVQKAEQFQVPAVAIQFERHFREFTVLFRPEDLRL
ncbi:MAG: cell envelope integrity protein TolA [Gammaproteobacteria bacterium]|jgi:colicin import membrane protein|nr:cell envelope integrity protein TolA [Gammaproteobacteria bacterium]MBT5202971.1 cell envelope integrity protein TolA [Gammaproteobacteria bacterium]MBT5600930.1 cell envelope integrity protein TolA [Gammaproteobacteria bacterium]MBT6245917.1 cell envelope integrity protein TolA [Gammaproteobacteria bacterium]